MTKGPSDPVRLSKTLSFLLRHKPEAGGLTLDPDGWTDLDAAARAAGKLMRRKIANEEVVQMLESARVKRFEIEDGKIRAQVDRRQKRRSTPPDILYHACTASQIEKARGAGFLAAHGRPLFLSADEAQAWRVAHRMNTDAPQVLYVDTTRARRHGVRFFQNRRNGLYSAEKLPVADVLNLQDNFAEQRSAGGIPIQIGPDGTPRMALIRVTRRSGITWEIAKGKLEPGETPEGAGIREVQEEMGIDSDLKVTGYVGLIRYGFLAPGGLPRLKSVYLYLMEPVDPGAPVHFAPRAAEGIKDVQWFTPPEACRAVTHSSLRPVMRRARELVERLYGDG
ncbi:MAG: RNA 2'-phosphotransferase [Alphaproteobacteria bacterium]|nr:RNA 2'-phosphotransferase [Alphaproteobacteria bacterium]